MSPQRESARSVRRPTGSRAFTLLELIVVIGIIAILAGLLLPAIGRIKARGHSVFCANNQRQLALACLIYAHDYDDALPYNFGSADTLRTVADRTYLNWVNNVMNWELDPGNTNEVLLAKGGLGPYTSGDPRIYRCPSDWVLSDLQEDAGWGARTRSVSMNAMLGNAGEFTTGGTNVNNPYYRQFFKLGQIPEPAAIFVFIEEHPDSVNDAYFLNRSDKMEWIDLPASHHNGSANLSFADGHVESHFWQSASTKPPSRPDGARLPFPVSLTDHEDYEWLMERTSLTRGKKYYTSHEY